MLNRVESTCRNGIQILDIFSTILQHCRFEVDNGGGVGGNYRNNHLLDVSDIIAFSTHIGSLSTGIKKSAISMVVVVIQHVDLSISC